MADSGVEVDQKVPMPPYIAFKTLVDVIDRMEREGPPTRVDPTYLESYAGGYRPTVIGNLQSMGLLEKTGEPTPVLLGLVAATDDSTRKARMAELVHRVYPDVLALPPNSTQGEFLDVFTARGAKGDTRRKAISFFLKACAYSAVEVGQHWKTPSAGPRRTPTANGKRESVLPPPGGNNSADAGVGGGETVIVDLGGAGIIRVHVDVKWLQLDDDTFADLRTAIKSLKALAEANPSPADEVADTDLNADGGGDFS